MHERQRLDQPDSGEARDFRAVLTPHRSLGPAGFLILMSAFGLFSFVAGAFFVLKGAWPVMGFFGLDVALLYWAFKVSYRTGRDYEMVELTADNLRITKVSHTGRSQAFDFNPYWIQVRLAEAPDGRTDLRIGMREKEFSFGRFLTDEDRRDFAHVLRQELVAARGGPRI